MYFLGDCKTVNKVGLINLPKKWRKKLGFENGELVEVLLKDRSIWVRHCCNKQTENQRYISEKGNVNIPAEFRRILDIGTNTDLCLYVECSQNAFIIKPDEYSNDHQ